MSKVTNKQEYHDKTPCCALIPARDLAEARLDKAQIGRPTDQFLSLG